MANQVRAVNGIGIVDIQEFNGVENSTSAQNMEKLNGSTWEYGGTSVTNTIPKTGISEISNNDDGFTYDMFYSRIQCLDDYRALCFWTASSSGTGGKTFIRVARAASGGTTTSYGTVVKVNDTGYNASLGLDVDLITNNKALVTAQDEDDSDKGKAYVVTISGTPAVDVAVGSEATFEADAIAWSSVAADKFTADKYVIVYDHNGDGEIQAKVCTVSGTTPSFGSMATIASDSSTVFYPWIDADPFNTGRYLITYNWHDSGDFQQYLVIISVSGTTITVGTPVNTQSGTSPHGGVWDKRTKNRIFCPTSDNNDSGKCKITPCSVEDTVSGDGKTITKGTLYTYYSTAGAEMASAVTSPHIPHKVLFASHRGDPNDTDIFTAPTTGMLTLGTITTEDADFFTDTEIGENGTMAMSSANAGWFWCIGRFREGFVRAGIMGGTY